MAASVFNVLHLNFHSPRQHPLKMGASKIIDCPGESEKAAVLFAVGVVCVRQRRRMVSSGRQPSFMGDGSKVCTNHPHCVIYVAARRTTGT